MNKYVLITVWGESLGIAWHLQRAGKEVIVGIVDDLAITGNKPENVESEKRRHRIGRGLLDTRKAETLVDQMQGWKDKDEWFVLCDTACLWKLADKLKDFKYGLFPMKIDDVMERDRDLAKAFVKTNYPLLKIPEVEEFKTVEDGVEFVAESEEFWALKGNDTDARTVVPNCKILDHAKEEIIDALAQDRELYERKGFILERQIRDGVEVCVEAMFWNGEMVSATIDLENKAIGSANIGYQVGCAGNLIHSIPLECDLVKMGIPDAARKIAKKHRGLFFIDANIIFKDGDAYFLEFCMRPGYDAFVTEMCMAGGPAEFFDALVEGENPLEYAFGVGIRGINLKHEDGLPKPGIRMRWSPEVEDHLWPFGITKDDGAYLDSAFMHDCIVFTGCSDDPEYAAIKAYDVASKFSYDSIYYRPQSDFFSRQYGGNIMDRLDGVQRYICAPE